MCQLLKRFSISEFSLYIVPHPSHASYSLPYRFAIIKLNRPAIELRVMDYSNHSLPLEEIQDIGVQMSLGDGPFPHSDVEEKEREVIHSNRVKLTDYIHDPTVLFPYMKESDVFNVFDCETIKGLHSHSRRELHFYRFRFFHYFFYKHAIIYYIFPFLFFPFFFFFQEKQFHIIEWTSL